MAASDDANRQDGAPPRVRGSIDGFEGQYLTGWAIAVPDDHTCVIEVRDESGHVVHVDELKVFVRIFVAEG